LDTKKEQQCVLLIAEHHDYPPGKSFIADNLDYLIKANFKTVLMESTNPIFIPYMNKNPDDLYQNLESLQRLHNDCKTKAIRLIGSESELLQAENINYQDPIIMAIKEQQLLDDIKQERQNTVVLLGGMHAGTLAKNLQSEGINVSIILIVPTLKHAHLPQLLTTIPKEMLLAVTKEDRVQQSLPLLLTDYLDRQMKILMTLMKVDSEKVFPEQRHELIACYALVSAFYSLPDKQFQKKLATMEYIIGSLYTREKNYVQALEFTKNSLSREQAILPLNQESIKRSEHKVAELARYLVEGENLQNINFVSR
jgi:hypothetical protein